MRFVGRGNIQAACVVEHDVGAQRKRRGLARGPDDLYSGCGMVTKDDVEGFLDRLAVDGAHHEEIQPGMWLVRPGGELDADVVVHYSPPVVLLRLKVMDLPKNERALATLSRRLLQLNASELVHGSYGIEGDAVVLTEALELAHLDYEEFLASYESMTLALASHLRELAPYREVH